MEAYECIDDYGRNVHIRKPTKCEWCCGSIRKNDVAVVRVYKWDGELNNARQHPECYTAMNKSINNDEMSTEGFYFGECYRGKTILESENILEK